MQHEAGFRQSAGESGELQQDAINKANFVQIELKLKYCCS